MTRKEFSDGVAELRRAFDLDEARSEVLVVWHRHLHDIEAREWAQIVKRMILTEERFPFNVVRTVNGYREPKDTRPAVFADIERGAEDDEAARECFDSLRRIGTWPLQREQVPA